VLAEGPFQPGFDRLSLNGFHGEGELWGLVFEAAGNLVGDAKRIVVLTGAGVSAELLPLMDVCMCFDAAVTLPRLFD